MSLKQLLAPGCLTELSDESVQIIEIIINIILCDY